MRLRISIILSIMLGLFCQAVFARDQHLHPSADIQAVLTTTAVHPGDKVTLAIIVNVKDNLHAQSHTPTDKDNGIAFTVTPTDQRWIQFGDLEYPPGIDEDYPLLGKLNVYVGKTVIKIPVTISPDAKLGPLKITGQITYQACNDKMCFPPESPQFEAESTIVAPSQPVTANSDYENAIAAAATTAPVATRDSSLSHSMFLGLDLDKDGALLAFPAAFLIGLIFNLMPCVLPVLPLKIMGFYEVSQHNRAKSISLGAVFSAGLIASFGVLAVLVVGLKTFNWGWLFSQVWFTGIISLVLVVMAISTFGFFTINVPNSLYSFTPRHDTYVGNFLFGILTAALSTPCTFGMFVGLLAWALKQPSWVGVSSIMMVGLGMASPYLVLSAIPEVARKFPRAGPWAEVIKQMMGFLLLATAIFFAQPLFEHFLSDNALWWTLFAVLASGGVFLILRTLQLSKNVFPRLVATAIALVLIVPTFYIVHLLTETPFSWEPYSDKVLAQNLAEGKPVLIDFTASWCTNCHYIEGFVLHNWRVVDAINSKKIVMLQADMTHDNAPGRPLLDKLYPGGSVPLTVVYLPKSPDPKLLDGLYTADDLLKTLKQSN
jgi:suppressor for copper-sensitivity B